MTFHDEFVEAVEKNAIDMNYDRDNMNSMYFDSIADALFLIADELHELNENMKSQK